MMISSVGVIQAQFLWYENETDTDHLEFRNTSSGVFFTDITNPNAAGINSNTIVSKFNRDEGLKAFLDFDLYQPVTNLTGFSITIKAYLDIPTEELTSINKRFRMYLSSSSVNTFIYKQLNFTAGQEWQSFTFNFDGTEITEEILNAGGYDIVRVGFANTNVSQPAATYYIDSMSGSIDQTKSPANWMAGSWGITFPVFGGERLDAEVARGYDLPSGAEEIVTELTATGHVFTNLSYFAHSHYFTLSANNNVDVATEIHPGIVPNTDNDEIIFEVLQKFKDADKKIILYISTNYFGNAETDNPEIKAAWDAYYTNNFNGDEYAAYKNLIQGFIEQVKDYADGYWLDTTNLIENDGKLEDFIAMIKEADPGAVVSANSGKNYLKEEGEFVYVDSDGVNDQDPTDYKIIIHEPLNSNQDFTNGHVTPIGQGAPPNSWAYEEYTIPNMVTEPWFDYQGKLVLKHAWFPIRARWHVPTQDLIFDTEQAYRFVKRITDGNASITLANTTDYGLNKAGYMMADEMVMMKEINNRLLSNPVPDYETYVRPEGAFLLGDTELFTDLFAESVSVQFSSNPVVDQLTLTKSNTTFYAINVVSMLGVSVIETTWSDKNLSKKIDFSTVKEGIYFVKLSDGNKDIYKKIMVSK